MFRELILLLLIISMPPLVSAQTKEGKLKLIRKEYQLINNDSSLKTKTLSADQFLKNTPDGGGELKGYFKGNTIYKIEEKIGLSYGEVSNEYYYKNGDVMFIYSVEKHFALKDTTGDLDYTKLVISFEGRYYFSNNTIIEQITKGKNSYESSQTIIGQLVTNATKYLSLLKVARK